MSRKYPVGVTLTLEEKQRIGFGARLARSSTDAAEGNTDTPRRSTLMKAHLCEVRLPDRNQCEVQYHRDAPRCHRFIFRSPLCEVVWYMQKLTNSETAIEAKAQELSATAFRQAQQAEQKEMRRATPPPGRQLPLLPPDVSPLTVTRARQRGGLYAVCIRYPSGILSPCGALHQQPEAAQREYAEYAHEEEGSNRVIGICCRWQRRWLQPQFLEGCVSDISAESPPDLPESS